MVSCAVYGCTANSNNPVYKKVSYFSFPKEENRRKTWLAKLNRANYKWSRHSVVCSKHFENSCFVIDPIVLTSLGLHKKQHLKPGSVPTLNLRGNENASNKPKARRLQSEMRSRRKELAELIYQSNDQLCGRSLHVDVREEIVNSATDETNNCDMEQVSAAESQQQGNVSAGNQTLTTHELILSEHCYAERFSEKSIPTVHQPQHKSIQCFIIDQSRVRSRRTQTDEIIQPMQPIQHLIRPKPDLINKGIQCSLLQPPRPEDLENEDSDSCDEEEMDYENDPDWTENMFDDLDSEDDGNMTEEEYEYVDETDTLPEFVLVQTKKILELINNKCQKCNSPSIIKPRMIGTMVNIKATCQSPKCEDEFVWESQETKQKMPIGNLKLCTAILASGSQYGKVKQLFSVADIGYISETLYTQIQAGYLFPCVKQLWEEEQEILIYNAQETDGLILAGDGRSDSPGFSAKYCSYTLQDVEQGKVIDFQLIQSNEVKSSVHMELEGLKRGLKLLGDFSVNVKSLVTDRHVQIRSYLKKEHPSIQHEFDTWHVSKSIGKKIDTLSSEKHCAVLKPWSKAITNHLYYCVATSGDNLDLRLEKWLSLLNHISDIHSGHSALFTKCDHEDTLKPRLWVPKGSIAHQKLKKELTKKRLLGDISQLSINAKTSNLEAFHRVILYFAPKHTHFSYYGMLARIQLACLHSNENARREQKLTKGGVPQWTVSRKKFMNGVATVIPVLEDYTTDYARRLVKKVMERRDEFTSRKKALQNAKATRLASPPPLCSKFGDVSKVSLIENQRSRYAEAQRN